MTLAHACSELGTTRLSARCSGNMSVTWERSGKRQTLLSVYLAADSAGQANQNDGRGGHGSSAQLGGLKENLWVSGEGWATAGPACFQKVAGSLNQR